jgi:lysozyme
MKLSSEGLALIKRWEGCKLKSYQDSADVWTIGYGRTTATGLGPVGPGMTITQAQAESDLLRGLAKYERTVIECLARTPTQAQYDAMVSLCYNIGQGAFAGCSVVKRFNLGKMAEAADAFLMWNKVTVKGKKVVVDGLTNRRKQERSLFLKASAAVAPAPKPEPVPEPPKPETPPPTPASPEKPGKGLAAVIGGILAAAFAALVYWITQGGNQ